MFRLLAVAAATFNLPVCVVGDRPVSAALLAAIEAGGIVDEEGLIASDALDFLGPGTSKWMLCADRDLSAMPHKPSAVSPHDVATSVVDQCVVEADGYARFVAGVVGSEDATAADRAFERMRTKMIRFFAAIEVQRRVRP